MTANTHLALYVSLTKGDMFLIEGQEYEFLAADCPGDGTMAIWARDPQGDHHTLYRRTEESVECPIYGV